MPAQTPSALILNVGRDAELLYTRGLLLQSAGYAVEPAGTATEAFSLFRAADFDLVLLCHSLGEAERQRLVSLIRSHGSATPVIFIATSYADAEEPSANLSVENTPAALLNTVEAMLQQARANPRKAGQQ